MPNHILFLIIFNSFVGYTRGATDQFLQGYGLFHDIWAPIAEVVINLTVAIIGVFMGTPRNIDGKYHKPYLNCRYLETLLPL